MRFIILSLVSLLTFIVASSSISIVQPRVETNDFLVRLILNISEEKVPDYLVDVIYDRPLQKEVTPENVLELFQVDSLTLNDTLDVLQALNIPSSTVFGLNGLSHTLEALHWSFTTFYNALTTSLALSGTPLRDALIVLQIDVTNFSSGITWGDPDPWSEFIKGVFTLDSISQACTAAGITVDELFGGIKDLIANEVAEWEIQHLVQTLLDHSIDQPEAVIIWNTLNITIEDVYNVELFRNILGNFSERINSQVSVGILTGENNIYINRKTHDLFETDVDLVNVYAETVVTKTVLTVIEINDTIYENIVVLQYDELPLEAPELTTIETSYIDEDLADCTYITLQSNAVFTIMVEEATFDNETFLIPRNTVNDVTWGSPLVCNETVYGLARELVGQTIILDAFEEFNDGNSSAKPSLFGYLNIIVLFAVWALTHVFRYE